MGYEYRWSSLTKENCVGAGEMFRTDLIGLLIVVGLYRRDWVYLVKITLARRRKGRNHLWISLCGASRERVGENFRSGQPGLVVLVGLYRRGGKYLVMATLVGRNGGKRHNHPWSSLVWASCTGVGIRIPRLLVVSAGM